MDSRQRPGPASLWWPVARTAARFPVPEHADVSEEKLQEALEQSRRVVEWADGRITTMLQGMPPA